MRIRLKDWLLFAAVFMVAALPFMRAVGFGIVNLDDYCYVTVHPEVTAGLSWQGLRWAFTQVGDAIWMPLTWLDYMLDYQLAVWFGLANGAAFQLMHLHSVLWHGLNAVLVWRLLCKVAESGMGSGERLANHGSQLPTLFAALAAMIWAAHPLRVESVAWIASRKDVVSMAWMLAALLCWIRWRRNGGRVLPYILSMLCLLVGGMAKPSVMVFVGIVFVLDWLVLRVLPLGGQTERPSAAFPWWMAYVVPVAICVVLAASAAWAQAAGGATQALSGMPFWARALNAAASFGVYLRNTVWPVDLAAECQMRYPDTPRFLLPGMVLTGLAGVYIWRTAGDALRRGPDAIPAVDRIVFAGVAIFCGALVPFLGLSNFGAHAFADRFTYIPATGLSIAVLGLALSVALREKKHLNHLMIIAAVAAIAALGGVSWRQTGFWRNDLTFWNRTMEIDGDDNVFANIGLAQYFYEYDHGNPKMLECFRRAFKRDPDYTTASGAIFMIGLCEAGQFKEAQEYLRYFQDWNDRMVKMEQERGELPQGIRVRRGDLDYARTAYLMTDPQLRPVAEEELGRILKKHPRERHALYLKGRLAEIKGDTAGRDAAWRELAEKGERTGEYVQYRWVERLFGKEKVQ